MRSRRRRCGGRLTRRWLGGSRQRRFGRRGRDLRRRFGLRREHSRRRERCRRGPQRRWRCARCRRNRLRRRYAFRRLDSAAGALGAISKLLQRRRRTGIHVANARRDLPSLIYLPLQSQDDAARRCLIRCSYLQLVHPAVRKFDQQVQLRALVKSQRQPGFLAQQFHWVEHVTGSAGLSNQRHGGAAEEQRADGRQRQSQQPALGSSRRVPRCELARSRRLSIREEGCAATFDGMRIARRDVGQLLQRAAQRGVERIEHLRRVHDDLTPASSVTTRTSSRRSAASARCCSDLTAPIGLLIAAATSSLLRPS